MPGQTLQSRQCQCPDNIKLPTAMRRNNQDLPLAQTLSGDGTPEIAMGGVEVVDASLGRLRQSLAPQR